jgi:Spy/CpxP family protein refolding chaperone
MLKSITPLLGAALLAAYSALYAQAPAAPAQGDAAKGQRHQRFDCSKAKDPKACEERRAKMNAAREKAKSACDAKKGDERRDCMRKELCAQSKDPAKCEARAKEYGERRKQMMEACKDKQGDERRACTREQRSKNRK